MKTPRSLRTPLLYYHTASQMDTQQLLGVAGRKLRATAVPRLPIDFDERYERRVPESLRVRPTPFGENLETLRAALSETTRERARRRATDAADGRVSFLGRERRLAGPTVDWRHEALDDLPRLWRLNLYGFEPLYWHVVGFDEDDPDAVVPAESFDRWIRGWERTASLDEPDFLRRKWTPYAVSLRVLHWTRYLAWRLGSDPDATEGSAPDFVGLLARQIYKNASFLEDHVERDVGGNHLVENGAALVVAGLLFEDDPGWTETGLSLLEEVARTQFLSDGGHFERSPMYHVLTVTRYLTVCDLLWTAGRTVPEDVERTAREGVEFLRNLRPPDGGIPLLNDSVFGQGLSLDACLRYAASVGVLGDAADPAEDGDGGDARRTDTWDADGGVSASGYRWLRSEAGSMLVDGGPVGPPHLPGHSHNDTLSYLLWVDGERLVTDTGVYDYEAGERRRYSRGVAGHNTVQVGDAEPIDIGGRFLMGPRTDPETAHQGLDGVELFEGAYEARPLDGPRYRHHRSVYAGEGWWLVWDDVRGTGGDPVRSRVHLHPSVDATADDSGVRLARGDDTVARIRPLSADAVTVSDGEYFPRFGEAQDRHVVEIETTGDDAVSFGYLVTAGETAAEVAVRADESDDHAPSNRPVRLDVDGDGVELPRPSLLNGDGSR